MSTDAEYRMKIEMLLESIHYRRDDLPRLRQKASDDAMRCTAWLIAGGWDGASRGINKVHENHQILAEFSPFSAPRFSLTYYDWVIRVLEIRPYENEWRARGTRSAYLLISGSLCLQATAFWYLISASKNASPEALMESDEIAWLCRFYDIERPFTDLAPDSPF